MTVQARKTALLCNWWSPWVMKISFTAYHESESHLVMSDSLQPHGQYSPWALQTRILEWVAVPFSKGSSQLRDQTQVSGIAGGFFTNWATREAQEYWSGLPIPSPEDLPDPGIKPGILYQLSYQVSAPNHETELIKTAFQTHFCRRLPQRPLVIFQFYHLTIIPLKLRFTAVDTKLSRQLG